MFCYQCEQTAKGEGCTKIGVCGKTGEVAALQDLLIHAVIGLSQVAVEGAKQGVSDTAVNRFACEAIFSTLTNVNFDGDRFQTLIPIWPASQPGTTRRYSSLRQPIPGHRRMATRIPTYGQIQVP